MFFNTDANLWTLELLEHGKRLGRIIAVRDGARLLLSDIRLENPKHKHQGIGSRLLNEFLTKAQKSGINEVWGSVTQDDIQKTSYLLDWYQRRGFSVLEPDDKCVKPAVRKIMMKLPNKVSEIIGDLRLHQSQR